MEALVARIRSIHPGLFTDESFMELTVDAPLAVPVLLGLWTEADDNGVFEWKPVQIKARTIPAAVAPIEPLLDVLIKHKFVRRFELAGRQLGAIRNFRRYQRPKKPKYIHMTSPELLQYVGSEKETPEQETDEAPPVPHQSGTSPELSPQMEEEGGRMEDESGDSSSQERIITRSASRRASKGSYAFEGAVIRLNQQDFDKWVGTFSAIPDLNAELTSLDAWLSGQPPDQRKRWFHVAAGALAKKHQSKLEDRKRAEQTGRSSGYVPMGPAGG